MMINTSNLDRNNFHNNLILNQSFVIFLISCLCYLIFAAIKPMATLPNINSAGPRTPEEDLDGSEIRRK